MQNIIKKIKLIIVILELCLILTFFFLFLTIVKPVNKEIQVKNFPKDIKTEKKVDPTSVNDNIKLKYHDEFNNKIIELIKLKYPYFIYEEIINNFENWNYKFNKEFLQINFNLSNYELNVYYKEIEKYLKTNFFIKTDYTLENGREIDLSKKHVAFTFDDGPCSKVTIKLIDFLEKNKSNATFFMLGINMLNNPQIVKTVFEKGFEVGSHGYAHKNFNELGVNGVKKDIQRTLDIFHNITGDNIKLVRPPYGSINNKTLKELKHPFILWNKDTNDWKSTENEIIKYAINEIKDGDIILFHDTYVRTLDAVDIILKELYYKNFQVVSVSELAEIKNVTLNNHELFYSFN